MGQGHWLLDQGLEQGNVNLSTCTRNCAILPINLYGKDAAGTFVKAIVTAVHSSFLSVRGDQVRCHIQDPSVQRCKPTVRVPTPWRLYVVGSRMLMSISSLDESDTGPPVSTLNAVSTGMTQS